MNDCETTQHVSSKSKPADAPQEKAVLTKNQMLIHSVWYLIKLPLLGTMEEVLS